MIADDFSDIAVRLKQIEQKTLPIESQWGVRFCDEARLPQMIAQRREQLRNVEFVQ